MIALLLLFQQTPLPTIGDTLWATRVVRLSPGDSVRAAQWDLEGPVQLLGRPEVLIRGDRAQVRYPLVAWEAGSHLLDVPGPIVTHASGLEDTLQVESMTLVIRSVLPAGVPDSELAVQPPATVVRRRFSSPLPAMVLGTFAGLVLLPLHWWWGRRGKPTLLPAVLGESPAPDETIRRWADAGERRVVASTAAIRLRAAIARQIPSAHPGLDTTACLAEVERGRPDWPREDLAATLRALDDLRFAPARRDNAYELYQRALRMERVVSGAGT